MIGLRETIVDDQVLHYLGGEADVYGSSLLNVLADCPDGRFVAPGYVGIAENGVRLQRRVRRILDRHCARPLKIGIASSMLVVVFALIFIPQARTQLPFSGTTKEEKMTANPPQLTHGFAYDVDKWIDHDESVEAALVRTQLMGSPHPDDAARIRREIDRLLAQQKPNGVFGDDIESTGTVIVRLLKLGASPNRPEISRGLDVMLAHTRMESRDAATAADDYLTLPMHNLHAACRAGRLEATAVRRTLQQIVDDPNPLLLGGCPWSTSITLQTLWLGRTAIDTIPGIRKMLQYMNRHINDAGCLGYRDPWGLVSAAATIDLPEAKELCQRLIPLILRGQSPGGGWGHNPEEQKSFGAIAVLKRHGFLDKLKDLPKLQSDWDVIGSIPLPGGKTGGVVWLNDRFWVINWDSGELQALSREDGTVLQRISFPEGGFYGVGSWDGKLAVSRPVPVKRAVQLDPDSGKALQELPLPEAMAFLGAVTQVNDRIWAADTYLFPGYAIDPRNPAAFDAGTEPDPVSPDRLESYVAGPCPMDFAVTEDGVWHADFFAGLLIKSGDDGKLLQWAAMPNGWTDGIAWDGEHLWAKSPDGKRLLMLQRSATAPGDVQQPGGEKALQEAGGIPVAPGVKRRAPSAAKPPQPTVANTVESMEIKGTEFKYNGKPSFTIRFPEGSTQIPLDSPEQVFAARTIEGVAFSASVVDVRPGLTLDKWPEEYVASVVSKGIGRDAKITLNAEKTLEDGTNAYRSEVQWSYIPSNVRLLTQMVAAIKDGRLVFIVAHPTANAETVAPIVESLRFETE